MKHKQLRSSGKSTQNKKKFIRNLHLVYVKKEAGVFSILVQNSRKVTKEVLLSRKVVRSCSLKKVAQNPQSCEKITAQNLERPNMMGPTVYDLYLSCIVPLGSR